MPAPDGKIRILSIDGGGARGLLALEILISLEKQLGAPIASCFDYITGCSTGGIIALAVGKRNPFGAQAMRDIYRAYLPQIFSRSAWQRIKTLGRISGPKYDRAALNQCVHSVIGDTTALGDTEHKLMVPSYNLTDRTPHFLSSYATPGVTMRDAALCTSAAPTYFSPWQLGDTYFVDGGVCDNDPALTAVIEACRLYGCTVRDCLVLSLGTGSQNKSIDGKAAGSWGLLSWAEPLVSIFTDGVSALHAEHLQRLLPDDNVLRLQTEVTGDAADMDNVSPQNLQVLSELGQALYTQNISPLEGFMHKLGA